MDILILKLCTKYAEASNKLQNPFNEVFNDFKQWVGSIDLSLSNTQDVKYMINIMTAIIDNGFCGEWMMFHYNNPWDVIEEYDL